MASQALNVKGIAFPFRFSGSGGVATSKADAIETTHIEESVIQCVGTNWGERIMEPEYGADLITVPFEVLDETITSIVKFKVSEALARWVPEVEVVDVELTEDTGSKEGAVSLTILYQVVQSKLQNRATVILKKAGE